MHKLKNVLGTEDMKVYFIVLLLPSNTNILIAALIKPRTASKCAGYSKILLYRKKFYRVISKEDVKNPELLWYYDSTSYLSTIYDVQFSFVLESLKWLENLPLSSYLRQLMCDEINFSNKLQLLFVSI